MDHEITVPFLQSNRDLNLLTLQGELTQATLMSLYEQKHLLSDIELIDVSYLSHVDSPGLALLAQICLNTKGESKKLIGVNTKLSALIEAYRLPLGYDLKN